MKRVKYDLVMERVKEKDILRFVIMVSGREYVARTSLKHKLVNFVHILVIAVKVYIYIY